MTPEPQVLLIEDEPQIGHRSPSQHHYRGLTAASQHDESDNVEPES
jgi:hypothetical protein